MLPAGDIGEAEAIADRVRRNFVAAAASHAKDDLVPSVSAGVTISDDPDAPVAQLLAAADQALYRAKANGRNRVECAIAPEPAAPPENLGERRRWRKVASA